MKKITCLLLIIMLMLTGCAKDVTKTPPGTYVPPENEPMPVVESFDEILRPTCINRFIPTEEILYNDVDTVFIAMPLETFEESELHYYAPDGSEYVHGVSERVAYHRTLRKLKVLEVLKGDPQTDEVYFGEDAYMEVKDGKRILHVGDFYDLVQKNAKYIFYLDKSEKGGFYFRREVINIDRLDYKYADETDEMFIGARKRFAQQFEKYDRFDELDEPLPVKETDYAGFLDKAQVTYTRYNSEQELYDASDLVFVGMPVQTLNPLNNVGVSDTIKEKFNLSEDYYLSHAIKRDVMVLEVLKGDYDSSIIPLVHYEAFVRNSENRLYLGIGPADTVDCKNAKYIYYVTKEDQYKAPYLVSLDYGRVNVDGLDKESYYDSERVKEVRDKFPEIFEKYDRTK